MISPDWTADAQEAIWEASKDYGVRLAVSEQVAISRALASQKRDTVAPEDVAAAFRKAGVNAPSAGLANEVSRRVRAGATSRPRLLDVVLAFRDEATRSLSRQYGGKRKPEDALRNNLLMYLPQRGYAEAHTGRGQTDILLPPPTDAIIETKVWTTPQVFEDGVSELGEYIRTEMPREAIFVLFGDRDPLPSIVDRDEDPLAEIRTMGGLQVPIVVVLFDVTPPSKIAQARRRTRVDNDVIEALLISIDRRLALLTAPQERDMRRRLEQDLLRTEGRIKMFDSIDGRNTSQDIARAAGVSDRAVQLFVKELLDMLLVRDTGTGTGRAVIVEQDSHALAQWYAQQLIAQQT